MRCSSPRRDRQLSPIHIGIIRSSSRFGAVERVTGAQQYAADIRLDNVLHVKLVSLACAHARIIAVDTGRRRAVAWRARHLHRRTICPQPIPRYGPVYADRPMLAVGRNEIFRRAGRGRRRRHRGRGRARGAARPRRFRGTAGGAVGRCGARRADAPLVQDAGAAAERSARAHEHAAAVDSSAGATSIAASADLVDRERLRVSDGHALRHRAARVSRRARCERRHGLEPDAASVRAAARRRGGAAAGRSRRVRIVAPDPGGGFGGKGWPKFEPLMAWLALRLGRPVRLVLTLEETFQAARRTSARIHARTGFTQGRPHRLSGHRTRTF